MKLKHFVIGIFSLLTVFNFFASVSQAKVNWPPAVGQPYPDHVVFIDQDGENVDLSDFKGKVLLVEYVGMNCPACQAFSGGNKADVGPFENNAVQGNLKSIEEIFPHYTNGLPLSDERITYISILLYDMKLGAPKPEDAKKWAEHFGFKKENNQHVLVPMTDLRGNASYNLIPGFQLIDRNFVLRSDSAGHHPRENLYTQLLPMVPRLLGE